MIELREILSWFEWWMIPIIIIVTIILHSIFIGD